MVVVLAPLGGPAPGRDNIITRNDAKKAGKIVIQFFGQNQNHPLLALKAGLEIMILSREPNCIF